ncbi:hypothetical protein Ddc_19799 [Ditylenchus destructor]|nr:hypothetical protein Ddc_19799 [Ditylenchus destructor]
MNNQSIAHRSTKRRRVNSSSTAQNQLLARKSFLILDDAWLEALKHLTCPQWSLMCLVSRQVNGIIQQNLSRLPRLIIEMARLEWFNFWSHPRLEHIETSMPRSVQLLFHPIVYFKEVAISTDHRKLSDVITNKEGRYICCHDFWLDTSGDTPGTRPNITALSSSLKWLENSVRSDSISFPEWVSYRVHETVRARAMLSNFIFGTSQKCKVEELEFSRCGHHMEFLNNLIEDFMALHVVQGTIPTVVIDYYPGDEQYRAHLGENLIDREVDSQGAEALYEIKSGDKRVRISFCDHDPSWNEYGKVCVKFYTI